jgi:NAD(P)H-hydrate epimerase
LAGKETGKRALLDSPRLITEAWAASMLPQRLPGAHKWGVGGVVIVAGSPAYAGAAALCCAAAGRSGAGIVAAALPRSIARVIVGLVPEATVVVLPEGESPSVAARASQAIEEQLERAKAMVIGPGLGTDEAAAALLAALFGFTRVRDSIGFGVSGGDDQNGSPAGTIARSGKPVVVDADAISWLASQDHWWERVPREKLILTPHPGEMARLLGAEIGTITASPAATALEAAVRWSQTVVLKGEPTVIAAPDGSLWERLAPASLATAGSGDVLSGSIAAFLAQGLAPTDAAALAVYVGCEAARRVERRYGTFGVVAGDLPVAIAEELCKLESIGVQG